ncbi:phosphotransferase enzyme family protein [Paracoccaceae bacterium Fryx2]|nr:phosphotransferase enzyme family protein [Paracoccaceae bacterium Fryx2]
MTDFDHPGHDAQLAALLELAIAATGHFALPPGLDVRLINLSENATYAVRATDGQRWALRIHRDGYHSRRAIASELAWLQHLRTSGVVVTPAPVPGKDGEIIQTVGHPRMKNPRHVVLSQWETGTEPGIGEDLSRPFEHLGEVTARMHRHTRDWQRPTWFTRPTWNFETALGEAAPHWGRWRDGIGVDAEKAALFARTVDLIGRRLAAYGQDQSRFGLIHCDLRLANLLIDGEEVKVIDFDDCGFSWYMYDAATPVSFYEHEPQVPDLIESWKTGYRKVLDLPAADEAEIPTFVMLRRLLLVAWIGSHAETDLARSMGLPYTEGAAGLCDAYLSAMGRGHA